MVWCSERCYKQDHEGTRKGLANATHEAGGAFLSLKKAAKFSAWLSHHQQRLPYVLIADWREAKPCMDILDGTDEEVSDRPALIVVYAESPKIFERATLWVKGMRAKGMQDRVLVVADLADACGLVRCVLEQTRLVSAFAPPQVRLSPDNLVWAQLASHACPANHCAASAASTASGTATPTAAECSPACMELEGSPRFGAIEVTSSEAEDPQTPCLRVHRVLSGILQNQDIAGVESMLYQAMPEFYDD